jgi:hypothetical protein
MPITADDGGGVTVSPSFRYEASFRLEHPDLDPGIVTAALSLPPHDSRPVGHGGASAAEGGSVCVRRLESDIDLPAALLGFADLLAPATGFLGRVREEGGRYGYVVLCCVDFNAGLTLDVGLLRRLSELRIDLTLHALAADGAESRAAVRRMQSILNGPATAR